MSRIAMSAKIPQLRPPQGLPQPPLIQGLPPAYVHNTQPLIVGSSTILYPPNVLNQTNNPAIYTNHYSHPYNTLQNPAPIQMPKSQTLLKA